jgi:hypothetical protein
MSFKAFGISAAMMATFAAGVVTPALAQTPQRAGLRKFRRVPVLLFRRSIVFLGRLENSKRAYNA